MKANMGTIDRSIRAIVGIALVASWPLGLFESALTTILPLVGAVLLVTAILRWCPPYMLLGINTCPSVKG